MKVKHIINSRALLLLTMLSLGCMLSCTRKSSDAAFALYYKSVSNIMPKATFVTETPSWHGPKPSDFAIDAIYRDGQQVQSEAFSISSSTGAITVKFSDAAEMGTYVLDISCSANGQRWYFPAAFSVVNAPSELVYEWKVMEMEAGSGFRSGVPYASGSTEGLKFEISSVSPATDKIAIDEKNGEIVVGQGHGFEPGEKYSVSVLVSNSYGSKKFSDAVTLCIVDHIDPIDPATLKYEDKSILQAAELSLAPQSGLVGTYIKFAFDNLPSQLDGILKIDPQTGEVSLAAGNEAPLGEYDIKVSAVNMKSSAETQFKLTVRENLYFFSKIVYGNNLGIDPESNANQFWYATADDMKAALLTPVTDAREGTVLEWSIEVLKNCGGSRVDATSGELSFGGFKANNLGLVIVTATAGRGEEGETTVKVPVFLSFLQEINGAFVRYAPFVMQANPKNGGRFNAPTVTGVEPASNFQMDWRRSFEYFNINGPESHKSGVLNKDVKDAFLYKMWESYYGSAAVNAGAKLPVSAWDPKADRAKSLAYIDKEDLSVVVNPEKWIYDGAYANGAFMGQATFITDGSSDNGKINDGTQIYPVWIWFDEKF